MIAWGLIVCSVRCCVWHNDTYAHIVVQSACWIHQIAFCVFVWVYHLWIFMLAEISLFISGLFLLCWICSLSTKPRETQSVWWAWDVPKLYLKCLYSRYRNKPIRSQHSQEYRNYAGIFLVSWPWPLIFWPPNKSVFKTHIGACPCQVWRS